MDNSQKIIELKAQIFDVLKQQGELQQQINILEQHKNSLLVELQKVETSTKEE